ncbi:helix-turn-helix transcriptional regulator [Phaeovibrio sulfidiphilus]|uniref:Helix-turn-helix transcriptional regulator n=1 Tax=Phaeovibrio sulfidiphilus TaxID=1220600 RepID=A0A8J6YX36_9PROT|nr:helix-turn-helix transcriptional regulator [Phaeovibrio sulfidiphilus]MBE1237257.1 helix-turn-helix transcriptional regulator [Phaeovibrio sulfidiphilus]
MTDHPPEAPVPSYDLKAWRKINRLTQDQAAFLFGITRRGYGKLEKNPETDARTRYAALYLQEHPEEIMERLKTFQPSQ